jgi:ATP-dependent Lon protease
MDHTADQLGSLHLPDKMPVMVLDDCYLFPGCFLPLFIFEERYRQMLASALDTDRMFCIGSRERGGGDGELVPVSTAAIIRACRKQEDGTSHVMLYGITRIRFTGWLQERPFRLASVQVFPTCIDCERQELERLKAEALSMLPKSSAKCSEAMQLLHATLDGMPCPEMVCDILAYHFVRNASVQRELLMEPSLRKRYHRLAAELAALVETPEAG